uniref:Uncharacterized protein n=1 Tax=Rhizophora mucronata TaxID=61149 RepID=A0A2P2P6B0_RHIMU
MGFIAISVDISGSFQDYEKIGLGSWTSLFWWISFCCGF